MRRAVQLTWGTIRRGNSSTLVLLMSAQLVIDIGLFAIFNTHESVSQFADLWSFLITSAILYLAVYSLLWPRTDTGHDVRKSLRLASVFLLAFCLRGGLFALLSDKFEWPAMAALLPAALVSSLTIGIGIALIRGSLSDKSKSLNRLWIGSTLSLVAYLFLVRLVYLGVPELLPEEAYYWNYSQHPSPGYLDHPPMVAWLIGVGTALFGKSEFGVRIGTLASWLIAAYFGMALTRELFGRRPAFAMLLLMSTLPFFFGTGLIATPDAPLTACWAGALFFLGRALLAGRSSSWFGAGICIGLGLLSKYTIALLVPAVVLFVITEGKRRHWLTKPQPYMALAIAAVLFAPVIYWNATHEWASFVFQTGRRLSESFRFSPHLLLGSAIVLLSPVGLVAAMAVLVKPVIVENEIRNEQLVRSRRFVLWLTTVPLAVFLLFSLTHEPKLNWTGPLWLALLPVIAVSMSPGRGQKDRRPFLVRMRPWWLPTANVIAVIYGLALYYLVLGLPGVPYPKGTLGAVGWKQLAASVDTVRADLLHRFGVEPLAVGLDKYSMSSEMAFYSRFDGPALTGGQHLFGKNGLSYRYWFNEKEQYGRNVIMIADDPWFLSEPIATNRFDSLTEIRSFEITHRGHVLGSYFYRTGYVYGPFKKDIRQK
ncbi:MAG: glycosyltransferase family 39 protein [Candidatus Zixiibacteriota bacterium]